MIDLHAHVLSGIDDGPTTLAESLELAMSAAAGGIRVLAATPHVSSLYPTSADEMHRAASDLRRALVDAGIDLELVPGGEIALNWIDQLSAAELRRFGLGGNPGYLLIEFPDYGWPADLATTIMGLQAGGFRPVLAHPERNAEVQAAPERLRPLVEEGVLVQLTAPALDGRLGRRAAATARRLLELGLAHLLASDAHALKGREIGLRNAAQELGNEKLERWLTEEMPGAIVSGTRLPARPPAARRRLWFLR